MTGLYRQTLIVRRREANADAKKVRASLYALENKDSQYAQEHRALLFLLEKVAAVYHSAPDELTPNAEITGSEGVRVD